MSVSSPSGLWWDRKFPESSRSLRQACLRENAVIKHHAHNPTVQQRFVAHTKALVIALQEACNHLYDDSHEVVIIDTREVIPDNVARRIMGAHRQGKKQHADFASHRLPAIDTKTATIATISSMWTAPMKTCTY